MGRPAGAPLRKRQDEILAVGRAGRRGHHTAIARRGHHMGEGTVGPGGGREKQVSGQARAFFLEAPESVGGVGETYSPTASPLFALRRPGCASRLAPGVSYHNSRAPLGAASRLRGARRSGPVVSSPSTPPGFYVGPRRRAIPDLFTVIPLYSHGRSTSSPLLAP